jgi:hypothetical protein
MRPQDQATFDPRIADWLEDDPNIAPDPALQIVLAAFPSIKQRRASRLPWRIPSMNGMTRLALSAVAIVAVAVGGLLILRPGSAPGIVGGPPATPTPNPTPTPVPSITAAPTPIATPVSTVGWLPFTSARYKYDIRYPAFLTAAQSVRQWSMAADRSDWLSPANDTFEGRVGVTVFSVALPAGTSSDAWIASYFAEGGRLESPAPCGETPVDLATKQVDGHPVVFWRESDNAANCGGTTAFVVVGDRLYTFFIGLPGWEPTLEAILSTVTFRS